MRYRRLDFLSAWLALGTNLREASVTLKGVAPDFSRIS